MVYGEPFKLPPVVKENNRYCEEEKQQATVRQSIPVQPTKHIGRLKITQVEEPTVVT